MQRVSIEVSVRRPGRERLDCVVASNATPSTALFVAAGQIRYYVLDPEGPLYDYAEALVVVGCEKCNATGRCLKPRTKHTYVTCKACGGESYFPVAAWSYTATEEERTAWLAWDFAAKCGARPSELNVPAYSRAKLDFAAYDDRLALHASRRERRLGA
jgi:hypothetical protein